MVYGVIKSRGMRWAGHVIHLAEMKSLYKIPVRKVAGRLRGKY
jgi:hypothetical protein